MKCPVVNEMAVRQPGSPGQDMSEGGGTEGSRGRARGGGGTTVRNFAVIGQISCKVRPAAILYKYTDALGHREKEGSFEFLPPHSRGF